MTEITTDIAPGTPTQVAHPGRTTLRTVLQVGIPAFLTFLLVVPMIIEAILAEPSIPDELRAWLVGLAAGVTAIAGIIARIMAIPAVEKALQKIKIGTGVEKEPTPVVDSTPVAPVTSTDGPSDLGSYDGIPVDEAGRHRGDYLGG